MKAQNLIAWACLALMISLSPAVSKAAAPLKASVQALPTDTAKVRKQTEELSKAINELADQIREMAASISEDTANYELNKEELDKVIAEMDEKLSQLEESTDGIDVEQLDKVPPGNDDDLDIIVGAGADDADCADTGSMSMGKTIIISDDGIKIQFGNKHQKGGEKELKNVKTQFFGLDLGVNSLLDNGSFDLSPANSALELYMPKSLNPTLYVVRQGVNLVNHHFYTTYGIAIDYHDYRFANDIRLVPRTDSLVITKEDIEFKKNKLSAHYLTVPLMFHVESNPRKPNRSFKLGVGGYAGFLVKSYTKQVSDERGKEHFKDDYNLNKLNYGLSAQIGYGWLQFYTHYALSPLFQQNKGPELTPLTFGLVINGFKWTD